MCKLLNRENSEEFRPVSRSIRIRGHSTSLRLEALFWRALDDLAKAEGVSTPKLVEMLHAEASELLQVDEDTSLNLASILRTACLLFERAQRCPAAT